VRVVVKAHGNLRRYVTTGTGEAEVEVAECATVRDLLGQLGIPVGDAWRISLNGDLVSDDQPLRDGDRLRLFSVVSGGARPLHATRSR
jgi:sulfur carrier protein ThiS